jgi:glycosyltransferase involved in cell wall biosynthesis
MPSLDLFSHIRMRPTQVIKVEKLGNTRTQKDTVALYFYRLGTTGGGAQRMLCLLANALVARGFNVHVISWDEPGATCFYRLAPEVKWHRLGFRPGTANKVHRARTLTKLLSKHGIGVLVGFVMSGDRTVFAAARLSGTKVIAAERNAPAMYQIRYGRLERWLSFASLHLANRMAVQSADFVRGYPATLRKRIEVIPNPVSIPSYRAQPEQPSPAGRFTLLAVGRLDNVQKCLDKLVDAFAMIAERHPKWDLLIIGDGPDEAALRRLAASRGVGERVGLQNSTQNIFQAYTDAHLFALPSRWEGFPNALAEALAHGLPAIGFRDAPGVAQLITHGETGWLADGLADAITLAKVLDEAMASSPERARRGANAARSVACYTPEVQFRRWVKLIRSVSGELNE